MSFGELIGPFPLFRLPLPFDGSGLTTTSAECQRQRGGYGLLFGLSGIRVSSMSSSASLSTTSPAVGRFLA